MGGQNSWQGLFDADADLALLDVGDSEEILDHSIRAGGKGTVTVLSVTTHDGSLQSFNYIQYGP